MTSEQPQDLEKDTPHPNHSTGPRTPEGKGRCRLNAFRHGLTGQLTVFTPEEQQAHDKFCKIIHEALAPVGDFERIVVQSIAADRWRLERARAIEAGIFALGTRRPHTADATGNPEVDGAFGQARTWQWDGDKLNLLTVYEQRIQRACDKNMAQLKTLQADRKEAAKEAMRQDKLLLQLAQAEGKPYRPETDFTTAPETRESVFSTAQVDRELNRANLFTDAETYSHTGRLPEANQVLRLETDRFASQTPKPVKHSSHSAQSAEARTCETPRTRVS